MYPTYNGKKYIPACWLLFIDLFLKVTEKPKAKK